MIVIRELINSSTKSIVASIESQDKVAIQDIGKDQVNPGVDHIDVNAGMFEDKEADCIKRLVRAVQHGIGDILYYSCQEKMINVKPFLFQAVRSRAFIWL
jgi:hypothetical protein